MPPGRLNPVPALWLTWVSSPSCFTAATHCGMNTWSPPRRTRSKSCARPGVPREASSQRSDVLLVVDGDTMPEFLDSIAIAGAWGYIGRKLLDAALHLGIRAYVYDPGPTPSDVD